jgi:hypothetical protein
MYIILNNIQSYYNNSKASPHGKERTHFPTLRVMKRYDVRILYKVSVNLRSELPYIFYTAWNNVH